MGTLQIKLFGRVQISHNNWQTEVNITRANQALLAYLLLQRHRTHSREQLAAIFWNDQTQEKARHCLNTTFWRLRCVLEPDGIPSGTYLISNHVGGIGFNRSGPYWLDVAIFEERIKKILTTPHELVKAGNIEELESAMQLYRGELLEGYYDDWALRERERLRSLYLNSLVYLMRYEKSQGLYEKALDHGQQVLELDPIREEIHREMMRLFVCNEQHSLAVRQYKSCCEILRAELDVRPVEETQLLYDQIVLSHKTLATNYSKSKPNHLLKVLQDLRRAAQSAEDVHMQLTRAIETIETFFDDSPGIPRAK